MTAPSEQPLLAGSSTPLARRYDVALLDLDGVVYVGAHAVRGAAAALHSARAAGMRMAFVTNNASRPPEQIAEHLTELGVAAVGAEVTTSAQAAAHYLAERLPPGASVLVVGTTGLHAALAERGLVPVEKDSAGVAAVVQGFSRELNWAQLAEGCLAINRGAPWVATNLDPTVPSPLGRLPGNGSMVAALHHATGRDPIVTGKPEPAMHRESLERSGAQRPIVVGDRLDTDIEGANAVGCASMLVFTGVTSPADLLGASPEHRPTYLAADLSGLLREHPAVSRTSDGFRCNGWLADPDSRSLRRSADRWREPAGDNAAAGDDTAGDDNAVDPDGGAVTAPAGKWDALRAMCVAGWQAREAAADAVWRPADVQARQVLAELGLN